MSKKTTPQEEKYSSYELEVLAVVATLKKFYPYLLRTKFKLVTDCSELQKTTYQRDLAPSVARCATSLITALTIEWVENSPRRHL